MQPPVAPGRYRLTNVDLRSLIETAFNLPGYQIANMPDWTGNERFDINAQMAVDVKPKTAASARRTFRRCRLQSGAQLPIGASDTTGGRGAMQSGYVTMDGFARMLSARLGRAVLDRRGLTGAFSSS